MQARYLSACIRFCCSVVAAAAAAGAAAQQFPDRPIRLVVPNSAGGGTDAFARVLANQVAKDTGWTLLVENRTGADGLIATDLVAKAAPDGQTLLFTTSGHLLLAFTHKLPYDPLADLAPVTALTDARTFLVVSGASRIATLRDLVATLRAKPGAHSFATPEAFAFLQTARFNSAAGVTAVRVPYRGAAQMLPDVATGVVTYALASIAATKPFLDKGALRALCVAGSRRMAEYPAVPSCAEEGVNYVGGYQYELYAPAKTSLAVVDKVQKAFTAALRAPDVVAYMQRLGLEPIGSTPADFKAQVLVNHRRIGDSARQAGLARE